MTLPYAAASIADLYGFSPAELAVDAAPMLERIHPDDLPRVVESIAQSEAGMGPWHAEYRYLHPTRGEIWVEGYSSPLRDDDGGVTWHGVLIEVTMRKQVEAQRDLWATAFTHCGHGIALGDPRSGHIVACNPAFGALLGRPPEAITGVPIPSLYAPAERPAVLEHIAEADRTGFCRYESEMLRADGTILPVQVDLASVRGEDATVRFRVATIQDITERLRASRELERRAEDLERSNTDLEQFAYVASHDLQEPLRAVAGCVQLLKKRYAGQLDARADEYIGYAVDGSVRMQRLIDDLLNYSRVGRAEGARQMTDTAELLTRALQNLTAVMQESGAVVTHDPMPVLSVYASQLSSVFQNLPSNAIKFRDAGRHPVVHVGAVRHEHGWEFSVRDNGIGIAPEYTDRIFGIFQRLHTRAEYPGTGMGLAMCKRIVERHGGRIWVNSQLGRGATFHFTIPDDH